MKYIPKQFLVLWLFLFFFITIPIIKSQLGCYDYQPNTDTEVITFSSAELIEESVSEYLFVQVLDFSNLVVATLENISITIPKLYIECFLEITSPPPENYILLEY